MADEPEPLMGLYAYGFSGSAQSRAAAISSASGSACCSAGGRVSYV